MNKKACRFCRYAHEENFGIARNETFYAMYDEFPASPGHTLIISCRHISSFFDLTPKEVTDFYKLILTVKEKLDERYSPDGYNIGVNDGVYAGQSVFHLHIHVIPRYKGDVNHPIGGVRNILPWHFSQAYYENQIAGEEDINVSL